jgi:hypothetical protein
MEPEIMLEPGTALAQSCHWHPRQRQPRAGWSCRVMSAPIVDNAATDRMCAWMGMGRVS